MSKAVRFDLYGDIDVLEVREVPSGARCGEVLVEVKAAGINPGEAISARACCTTLARHVPVRAGQRYRRWSPTSATAVDIRLGDEVLGFSENRSSQAEFVAVPAGQLTAKPPPLSWEVAGSLYVAGTTAYAAVRAVGFTPGDTIAVAAAAGGVGTVAVQLARRAGATVLGIAGPADDDWLTAHGVIPVS